MNTALEIDKLYGGLSDKIIKKKNLAAYQITKRNI